jgi:hypothetical protein
VITEELYKAAHDRLSRGLDGLNDDDLEALTQVVESYKAQQKAHGSLDERRSFLAPELGEPGLPDIQPEPMGKQSSGMTGMEKVVAPVLAQIPKKKTPLEIQEQTPQEREAETVELRKRKADLFDTNLPSASKMKTLYRSPELIPQSHGIMDALPSTFGGNVDHYIEPTYEQFQRETGLSPQQAEDSDEFKRYSDAKWADIYDRAQAEGRGVVRQEYVQIPEWKGDFFETKPGDRLPSLKKGGNHTFGGAFDALIERGVFPALGKAASAAHGADLAFAGIPSRLTGTYEEGAHFREANPLTSALGSIAGAFNPNSVGGLAATATKAAARKILPEAALALGRTGLGGTLAAGGTGAVAAASDVAANRIAENRLDDRGNIRGIPLEDGNVSPGPEPFDVKGALEGMGAAGLTGFLVGGGTHGLLGSPAGNAAREFRYERPEIAESEYVGNRTSARHGFVESPDVKELELRARARPGAPEGRALATQELSERLGAQGRTQTETLKNTVARQMEEYEAATKGVKRRGTRLAKGIMGEIESRMSGRGDPILAQNLGPLAKMANSLVDVEAVPAGQGHAELKAAQAQNPDAWMLDGGAARRSGLNVKNSLANYARSQRILDPLTQAQMHEYDFDFIVKPRDYTAREWEAAIKKLSADASEESAGARKDPAPAKFVAQARDVRDEFPEAGPATGRAWVTEDGRVVKGWSALAHEHEALIAKNAEQLEAAGQTPNPQLSPRLRDKKLRAAALDQYANRKGVSPDELAGIHELARNAGEESMLKGVRGLRSGEKVKALAKGKGHQGSLVKALVTSEPWIKLRLDPMLSTLGLPMGERSFEPGYRPDTGNINNPFRLTGGRHGGAGMLAAPQPQGKSELTPNEARALERMLQLGGQF